MWFKQCHYLCSFRGRVVSDLRLPWRHYVQHFTLILLLCENDLWLTEGSANFLRFHAWRNNKPCFCPADGFLFLLSPLVLCVDIKSSSFILPKHEFAFSTKRLCSCAIFSLFSERLSIWCNNSENKLRVYNTVLVLELILVSWCIILHPASDLESCQSLCLNQLVLMALPLHRIPLWWWHRN